MAANTLPDNPAPDNPVPTRPLQVTIRTDASLVIGTGHVMRCLTLAAALRHAHAQVTFVCRAQGGNLIAVIRAQGFAVQVLPEATPDFHPAASPAHAAWLTTNPDRDAAETIAALANSRPDWLIVDHYAIDAHWERQLAPHVSRIMVLDDLADRDHCCALLLDQNMLPGSPGYQGLVPATCQLLLGPHYALLRPEFAEARAKLRPRDGHVRRLLLFFGGIDAANATEKALDALDYVLPAWPELEVDVVIGAAHPQRLRLEQRIAALPRVHVHVQIQTMAALMARADLSLGAGGATTWERCCLGLPTMLITVAANQRDVAAALAEQGYALLLGDAAQVSAQQLAQALAVMHFPALLRFLGRQSQQLVDGQGVARVAAILCDAAPREDSA